MSLMPPLNLSGRLGLGARFDFYEETICLGQDLSMGVEDLRLGPVLACLGAGDSAFDANLRGGWNGTKIVHLHMARHRCQPLGTDCLGHCFIQKSGDYTSVKIPMRPLKGIGDIRETHYGSIRGKKKLKTKAVGVVLTATEAVVLSGMGHGNQIFCRKCHTASSGLNF